MSDPLDPANIKGILSLFNFQLDKIKYLIIEYFSDELQHDETPMGAMKRNQIRKELLEFAHKKSVNNNIPNGTRLPQE